MFSNDEGINPVKITLMEYKCNPSEIHMAMALPAIKKAEIAETHTQIESAVSSPAFGYKLSYILHVVKKIQFLARLEIMLAINS